MTKDPRVLVRLKRPPGYDDVHPELVVEDALREQWPWEVLADEGEHVLVAITRLEDYESAPAKDVVREAVKSTWTGWTLASERIG